MASAQSEQQQLRRDIFKVSGALVLSVLGELLADGLTVPGTVRTAVTAALVVLVLILVTPTVRRLWKLRRPPAQDEARARLRSHAERAQHWLEALGSSGNGLAAAEWFEQEEKALRKLLDMTEPTADSVDDLARIADALDTWYVRTRRGRELLTTSERLSSIANLVGRTDLQELANLRTATANRLLGELAAAAGLLDDEPVPPPPGQANDAMRTRRLLERGLLHLALADRCRTDDDRADEARTARDRLNEAGMAIPRADLAADIALHINLALTYLYESALYESAPDAASEHARLAMTHAETAHDSSAQAHASELFGVAATLKGNHDEARSWWQEAERRYAEVGEREAQARCLQHLGALAVAAGEQREATELLTRSARLRGGAAGHEVLEHYLGKAASADRDETTRPRRAQRRRWCAWPRRPV
ncbi:MAG TPA: tetratricopeptide repeat protein [Pseudonocardiaceae bacterium]|nr:tetratricopeptide repeat protein [Pseudonocardiaceae bacterium]